MPCAAHACTFVIEPSDSSATKSVQIFSYSEGEWVTVWMCDEHCDGYRCMADQILGLQVKF